MRIGIGIGIELSRIFASGTSIDPDAQAFITAAGITDPTQQSAVNFLFKSLKGTETSYNPTAINFYNRHIAFYPIVGGSATSHKFNGMNPVDSNSAYRLVFNGGWTHSANGMLPNGTNGYAQTYIPENVFTPFNLGLTFYSRTNAEQSGFDLGSNVIHMYSRWDVLGSKAGVQCADANRPSFAPTDSLGMYTGVNAANNLRKIFKNGTLRNTNTTVDNTSLTGFTNVIGAINFNGSILAYTSRQGAFAAYHQAWTDAEALVYYNIIQQYQTILGRNV